MMATPMKTLESHYQVTQFLIITIICCQVYETNGNGYCTSQPISLGKRRAAEVITNQTSWALAQRPDQARFSKRIVVLFVVFCSSAAIRCFYMK